METKHHLPTKSAPEVREHPGQVKGAERENAHHHAPTKHAPQIRKVPGLGEPLVKVVAPEKVERRIVKPQPEEK